MSIRTISQKKIAVTPTVGKVSVSVITPDNLEWEATFSVMASRRLARLLTDILEGRTRPGVKKNVPAFDGKSLNAARYDNENTGNNNVMLEYYARAESEGLRMKVGWTTILAVDKAETLAETVEAAAEIAEKATSDEAAAEEWKTRRVFIAV